MDRMKQMWKKVSELSLTWPTTGKPFKEVFKNILTGETFTRYYNENGVLISSDEYKVLPRWVF